MTAALALVVVLLAATPAFAFDAAPTFGAGTTVMSAEVGGGHQSNLEGHSIQTGLDLWNFGVRYALVPFEPAGPGLLRGALEAGLELAYQSYEGARDAYWVGVGAQARWHFLSLGRFVPYLEGGVAGGVTNLEAIEIDSDIAFRLNFGGGASVFVTERAAVYAGYRLVHMSNGNLSTPNRGFEAHTGVLGVSYFFK